MEQTMEHKSKRLPFNEISISRTEQLIQENDKSLRSAIFTTLRRESLDKNQMQQLFFLSPLMSKNSNMVDNDIRAKRLYEESVSVGDLY